MPEDNLIQLHTNLRKKGFKLPDYEKFKTDMADSNNSLKLHTNLVNKGFKLPDYNTFVSDISPQTLPSKEKLEGSLKDTIKLPEVKTEPVESTGGVKQELGKEKPKDLSKTYDHKGQKITVVDTDKAKKKAFGLLKSAEQYWTTPSLTDYMTSTIEPLDERYPDNYYILKQFERSIAGLGKEDRAAMGLEVAMSKLPDDAKEQLQMVLDRTQSVFDLQEENPLIESGNNVLQDLAVGIHRHTKSSLAASALGLLDIQNPFGRIENWWRNNLTGYGLRDETVSDLISEITGKELEEGSRQARDIGQNLGYMGEMAAIMYATGGLSMPGQSLTKVKEAANAAKGYAKLIEGLKEGAKGALKTGVQFEISNQSQAGRGEGFMTGVGEYVGGRAIGSLLNTMMIKSFGKQLSNTLPNRIAYRATQLTGMIVGGVGEEMIGDIAGGASIGELFQDKHYLKNLITQTVMLSMGGFLGSPGLMRAQRNIFEQSALKAVDQMIEEGEIPIESKDEVVKSIMQTYDAKEYIQPAIDEIKNATKEATNGIQEKGQEKITSSIAATQTSESTLPVTPTGGSANVEETGSSATTTPSTTEGEVDLSKTTEKNITLDKTQAIGDIEEKGVSDELKGNVKYEQNEQGQYRYTFGRENERELYKKLQSSVGVLETSGQTNKAGYAQEIKNVLDEAVTDKKTYTILAWNAGQDIYDDPLEILSLAKIADNSKEFFKSQMPKWNELSEDEKKYASRISFQGHGQNESLESALGWIDKNGNKTNGFEADESRYERAKRELLAQGRITQQQIDEFEGVKPTADDIRNAETGLNKTLQETAKSADAYIGDAVETIGLTIQSPSKKTQDIKSYDISSPLSRGLRKSTQSLAEKTKERIANIKNSFKRAFPLLDPKRDGAEIDVLRRFTAIPEASKLEAMLALQGITAGLGKNAYQVFSFYTVLNDLKHDVERGLYEEGSIPFYETSDKLNADYEKFNNIVSENTFIQEAVNRRNNFMNALRQAAVDNNILPKEVLNNKNYYHHMVIEYMNLFPGVSSQDFKIHKKGWQKERKGSSKDFITDYLQSEFHIVSGLLAQLKTVNSQKEMEQIADITPELKDIAKTENTSVQSLIPEDYTEWSPKEGHPFHKAMTLDDKVVDRLLAGEQFESEMVKQALVLGRKKKWIIPKNLAKTLDSLKQFQDNDIENIHGAIVSSLKQWMLINPIRALKYNLNNMVGDADIAFAYNPKIFKYFMKSAKDLYDFNIKKKTPVKDILEALNDGVINSGITINEIPDIHNAGVLKSLVPSVGKDYNLIAKFWNKTKDYTTWRENILRLAAYRFFKDELAQGKTLYGASTKEKVDAVTDKNKRAALLARELIGDYGNISQAGQWIRKQMIPFYSWLEVNAPRYVRMMKNAHKEDRAENGGKIGMTARKMVSSTTSLAVRSAGLYALIYLWNRAMFPDDDDKLNAQGNQLHLILGHDEDGNIRSIRFQGALSDALEWIGLNNAVTDYINIKENRKSWSDQIKEMSLAGLNKVIQGTLPVERSVAEALLRKSMYPKFYEPVPVRDPIAHALRLVSADWIYKYIQGIPQKRQNLLSRMLLYSNDPDEINYYLAKDMVRKFNEEHGRMTGGGDPTERSNALYYYKKSIRYGDADLAKKWLEEYYKLGGTQDGIQKSIHASHPVSGIGKKDRAMFLKSLSPKEKDTVLKAIAWYQRTYKP